MTRSADRATGVAGLDPGSLAEGALARIHQHYLFPDRLERIESELRRRQHEGAYDALPDLPALCRALTDDLRAISGDKQCWLCYSEEPQTVTDEPARAPVSWEEQVAELTAHNFRFERVERLRGNVGYLDLRGFVQPEIADQTATAAMTFLAHADALIVDLRRNSNGDPASSVGLAVAVLLLIGGFWLRRRAPVSVRPPPASARAGRTAGLVL
jgi:hypothetical protein